MKKRGLIIFDIVMSIIVVLAMFFSTKVTNSKLGVQESKLLADNSEYSFDFVADPGYSRVKAGETVTIMLSLENLRMGENGLNNVVGYLTYDESVFEELNIEGVGNWNFERNENKNHEMFGKFVIYTMQEGVTENQNIVKITAKLKADLQPQTTEINFTKLKTSDGEVSVSEQDKTVVIEIYEESVKPEPKPQPRPEPKPEEPVKSEVPDAEEKQETVSIKTGDAIALAILILIIATIALNIALIYKNKETKGSKKGLKLGIITGAAIIIVGLIVLAITVFAHNAEIIARINSLDHSESWLNSEKYFVTDESVSRIAPLTNINEIEDKFNKEIDVFKKNPYEKTTEGLVSTGMWILDGQNMYAVSVLGDINGDGESNQIELTNIIRATVNPSTWSYSGVEKLSADMNVNGIINAEDVNTSIRYILYGELSIPGFNQVVEPKIEVVGGTFNQIIDAYEDTVQVNITVQDENATKTKYMIEGPTSTEGWKDLEEGELLNLTENGVYKISAYSYGELGNRSKIPYIIIVKKNPNNNYKVITKTENVDGTYDEEIEEKQGRIGDTVTAGEITPEGFSINQEQSTLTGVVTSEDEEELTLVVTYDRNEYTLTIKAGDNVNGVAFGSSVDDVENTVSRRVKFGRAAEIIAKVNEEAGYIITFNRWSSSNTSLIVDNTNRNTTIEMPIGDITLTAIADRVAARDTMYKVEYYYQQNGAYSNVADDSRIKNGETDTVVEVDSMDKTPTRAGYVLDTSKQEFYSGTVAGDGSLVLKVFFKQQFTVTYKPGDKGTFTEEKTENLDYGAITPAFAGNLTCVAGYEFAGWDSTISGSVTENKTYTATWQAKADTIYHIQYFLEKFESDDSENPNNYTLGLDMEVTGTTDRRVLAPIKLYTGFTYDSTNPNGKADGIVAGDGSLVLAMYYKRNSYELTLDKYENVDFVEGHSIELNTGISTDPETGKATFKYEQPIEITATLKDVTGYTVTFSKWESGNTELLENQTTQTARFTMPAGDITLTAVTNQVINKYAYKVRYFKVDEQFEEVQKDAVDYGTVITTYDEREVTGYELDEERTGNINLSIGTDENQNIINVYYKPIFYSINYDLAEGTLPQGQSNPSEYSIITDDFALVSPTRLGYVFKGWTGGVVNDQGEIDNEAETGTSGNVTVPTVNLNVQQGSIGNRKYTANWEEDNFSYTVEYYYEADNDYQIDENKTETRFAKYNSTVLTYTDKAVTGYELRETPTPITISYNIEENVMKVYYKKKVHAVILQKDDNIEEVTGAGTYKYGDTVSINATLKTEDGYTITWDKWEAITTGVEDENNQTVSITIPDKDVVYKATATKTADSYSIDYMLNGGDVTGNPRSYTIESEDIELSIPTKQGYVFQGWTGGTEKENPGTSGNISTPTRNVTIRQGSMGNRLYTANWVGDTQTAYKVEHYKENLDGTFTLADTVNGTGTTDETAIAVKKTYEGFEFDEENSNNLIEANIKPDGSLVLKVYYKRIVSTLRLATGNNITKVEYSVKDNIGTAQGTANSGESSVHHNTQTGADEVYVEGNFKYGAQINISATVAERIGYTITWNKWESNAVDKIVDQAGQTALIGMPVGNVTLTAKATSIINSYGYTIEYYYDEVKDDTKTETNTATYGSTITNPRDKAITGYELDRREGAPLTITENEETNIIKIFYKQTVYSIEYNLAGGEMPVPEQGQPAIENPTTYTVNTESFTLYNPVRAGYTFLGWTGTNGTEPQTQVIIEQGSTGDRDYTANWRANTDTQYKIEYYLENLDGTYTKEMNDEVLYGTTGEVATTEGYIRAFEGYTHDSLNENAVESGTINGDGDLVLKVYYKRNIYTLRLVAGDNVQSVTYTVANASWIDTGYSTTATGTDIELKAKYGATVSIDGTLVTEQYYNITNGKWTSNNANVAPTTLNANIVIPAGNVGLVATATKTGKPYNYSTEYYYENTLEHTSSQTAAYNTQITTYAGRSKTGYKFDHVEGLPLTITNEETNNVIKVYYILEDYTISYTLNGGELVDGETNPNTYTVETNTFTLHNPVRQGYVFLGWTGSNGTEAQTEVTVEKGSTGNRSYTANWRPSTDTGYTIEYYTENLDSTENPESAEIDVANYTKYNATTEQTNKIGTTGETVTATPIEIAGFTYNAAKSAATISGAVAADGSLVLKVFYTRNSYNLTLTPGENIIGVVNGGTQSATSIQKSYKYGQTVAINALLSSVDGHTTNFSKWTSSNTSLIPSINTASTNVTIPAGNVELTASANAVKANFTYSVEFYYDGVKEITEQGDPTEFGSQILTYSTEGKERLGYVLDRAENLPLTITSNPQNNVIRYYFELKNYTVSYDLDGGALGTSVTNPTSYNVKSADFTLNNPLKLDYTFLGWTGGVVDGEGQIDDNAETGTTGNTAVPTTTLMVETGSVGNRKYTANWQRVAYRVVVHHYVEGTGTSAENPPIQVAEDEVLIGDEIGKEYTTADLIPEYDEHGEIINPDADVRHYLDPNEIYFVSSTSNTSGTYTAEDIEVTYYYQYYPTVKIVSSPDSSLVGQEFIKVADALNAIENAGLNRQSEPTRLQLIRNVKDESVVIENQNIELDLNSLELKTKVVPTLTEEQENTTGTIDENAAIKLVNSKLVVIDDSEQKEGKITSEHAKGIYIKPDSEFTIGIEAKPIETRPEIFAETIGIYKEVNTTDSTQGTFNLFDGKITAGRAINGAGVVDLTPIIYEPTSDVTQINEKTYQVLTLGLVNGVEARIGRQTYEHLEDAIADANTVVGTDGSQVEIVLVTDITKTTAVNVPTTKNIKLDLAGYTFTSSASDYAIVNSGYLEIVDSTANAENTYGTGKITNSVGGVINNTYGGKEFIAEYTPADWVSTSTYQFVEDENGNMVSTNQGVNKSSSYAYVHIDLTDKEEGKEYYITINAGVSSEANSDWGSATIRTSTDTSEEGTQIFAIAGETLPANYSGTLVGGNDYYIHFQYAKDRSKHVGSDKFTVYSVKLYSKVYGNLKLTSGNYEVTNGNCAIINNGDATIGESTESETMPNIYGPYWAITNNRDMVINNGYVHTTYSSNSSGSANNGNITINGGTFTNDRSRDWKVWEFNSEGKTQIINGGTFNAEVRHNNGSDKLIINGGTFYTVENDNSNGAELEINGGTFKKVIYKRNGKLTINDGTFNSEVKVQGSANSEINGGTFNGYLGLESTGTSIVNNATVHSNNTVGIYNASGIAIINNANVVSDQSVPLRNDNGTMTIYDGIYTAKANYTVQSNGTGTINLVGGEYITEAAVSCIYSSKTGTIVLGNNEDEGISKLVPSVTALSGEGVSNINGGTFKFYDGIIKTKDDSTIVGILNEIPENARLDISYEDNTEIATIDDTAIPVAQIGETTYTSLESAIAAVPSNNTQTTIKMLRNIPLVEGITIPENKNIVLDMQYYDIRCFAADKTIENNGTLEIKAKESSGTIDITSGADHGNGFVLDDGKLVSTTHDNYGVNDTYVAVDLTNREGYVTIKVNASISSESNCDVGKAIITESADTPETFNGALINISGENGGTYTSGKLKCGKMYYLHFRYQKDSSVNRGTDTFTINSVELAGVRTTIKSYSNTAIINNSKLDIKNVKIHAENVGGVVNLGSAELELNGAEITTTTTKCQKLLYNTGDAKLTINDGYVHIDDGRTFWSVYALYNDSTEKVTINGGTLQAKKAAIYNTNGGIIETTSGVFNGLDGDNTIYNDNGELIIRGGTFYDPEYRVGIRSMTGKITVYGGTFKRGGSAYSIYANSGTELIVNGGTFEESVAGCGTSTVNGGTLANLDNWGTMTVNDGIITRVYNAGTMTINNGTFGTIENSNNATMTINDATVSGSDIALNNSSGTLTVLGGSFIGNNYGIYTYGTTTIGTKGDGTVSTQVPYIKGNSYYGVYIGNNNTFNFYDGYIEGPTNEAIDGIVTDKEDGYEIVSGEPESGRESKTLQRLYVAQIESTGNKYYSIQDAVNACQAYVDGDDTTKETITILREISIGASDPSVEIPGNKYITLDLNGNQISASNETTFTNEGKFNITDSSEGTTGLLLNGTDNLIENIENGKITLTSVKLTASKGTVIVNNTSEDLNILSGTVINAPYGVKNNMAANIIINAATFTGTYAIVNESSGSVTITAATISSSNSVINNANGTITVNSGTITSIINQNGMVNVNDGTISGVYPIRSSGEDGIVNINGGTLLAHGTRDYWGYSLYMEHGTANIRGGTLTRSDSWRCSCGLFNDSEVYISDGIIAGPIEVGSTSTLEITGGTVNAIDNSGAMTITAGTFTESYTPITNKGTATISNVTLPGTGQYTVNNSGTISLINTTINNTYNYGDVAVLYNTGTANLINTTINTTETNTIGIKNTGTLSLGVKNASGQTNEINGGSIGILQTGEFNYYCGTITGTEAIQGKATEIADNKVIKIDKDSENNLETASLVAPYDIVQIGETKYTSLQDAIDTVATNAGTPTTIKFIEDACLTDSSTISSDKDIIIDLDGHKVRYFSKVLTNSGKVKIIDNNNETSGMLKGYAETVFENTGTLETAVDIDQNHSVYFILNNAGTVKMSAGDVSVLGKGMIIPEGQIVIQNSGTGTVELSGANITYNKAASSSGTYHDAYGYLVNCIDVDENEYSNITVSGGTINDITDSYGTIIKANRSHINLSGGSITGYSILECQNSTLDITAGEYTSKKRKAFDISTSVVNITGGTITTQNSDNGLYFRSSCQVQISGNATINATGNGTVIQCYSNSTLEISGNAVINAKKRAIVDSSEVIIRGGEINSTEEYCIYVGSNTTILGGTITSTNSTAIYQSGQLTIGDGNYPVSTTVPEINGGTYGIEKRNDNLTLNFYDGKITGGTKAISGTVTATPELYNVSIYDNETMAILEQEITFDRVCTMNGINYNTIQAAVDAAGTSEVTITLTKNVVISDPINVGNGANAGANITIDLNGRSITIPNANYAIKNYATLKIVDSSNGDIISMIENKVGTAIYNEGTLTLGVEELPVSQNKPSIIGAVYGIENNGILNFFDGLIKGDTDPIGGSSSTMTIPDGYKYYVPDGEKTMTLVEIDN